MAGLDPSPTSFPPLREDSLALSSGPDAGFLATARVGDGVNCISPSAAGTSCSPLVGSGAPADRLVQPIRSAGTTATAECVQSSTKTWSQAVKAKGNFSFSLLKFFPPSEAGVDTPMAPPAEVLEQGSVMWGSTLVDLFHDKPPHFLAVDSIVRKIWAKFGLQNVAVTEKGIFFFTFDSAPHMEACLAKGPWAIKRNSIFLKRWSPGMPLDSSSLKSFPMWISLVNVPIEYWTPLGLSWIARNQRLAQRKGPESLRAEEGRRWETDPSRPWLATPQDLIERETLETDQI